MQDKLSFNCQNKKSDFATTSAEFHYRPNLLLEPIHQKINLSFTIKESLCQGSVTHRIKANNATTTNLQLNASNFTISAIKSFNETNNQDFSITWGYDGSIISVSWADPWKTAEIRELEIIYEVKNPIAGLYYSYPDEFHPEKPVYVGADHETERARYWLPCVDHPSIRTTLEFYLTSDSTHTILANGKFLDEKITGDKKTAHWLLDFPCPSYLITLCIGDLVSYSDRDANAGNGFIPVKYFTTKQYTANDLKLSFDRTPKMLEWMNKKLGVPLPYPKYYQYALPQHGGAMENISLVSWDDFAVLDDIFSKEFTWSVDQTNVHEMAHSWFGDAVVIKDFAHAWMKESWATYMETVWLEEMVSKEEADYDRFFNERRYKNETKKYVRPIVTNKYDSSWMMFDNHLYPGGSQRIDMLRKMLGDETFWKAVTDYLKTFQGKFAETSDFQHKLEENSGLNLQKFFDQWYYSKGFPILKISYKFDDKNKLIELKIKQAQVDKEKQIGLFEFPLEVMIETLENQFTSFAFNVKDEDHVFYVKTESEPKQIEIDPKNKVLMDYEFNPGTEMLKRIYKFGSIKNKILASNELAKDASLQSLDFLTEQYKSETFWGLKNELLESIGTIYNPETINRLLSILETEKDPLVLKELFRILQNQPITDQVVHKVQEYLARAEPLYLTQSNALQILGLNRSNSKEMFEFLRNYQIQQDKKEIIKNGKRIAIGKLRSQEGINYLLNEIKKPTMTDLELPRLIDALSEAVVWAEDKVQDELKEIFINKIKITKNQSTLRSLGNALARFNDPSLNTHLQKMKAKFAFQDHPMIDKMIERNKAKTPNEEFKKLDERLTKMEKENLELKDKVSKLESLIKK